MQLNREELSKHRSSYAKKLIALAKFYYEDDDAKELLDQAMDENNSNSEYLAFARMVKEKYL